MILAILLCSLSIEVNVASAQTLTITILPDGSVDHSSSIQRNGNIYVLTPDIMSPIEIQRGNIILDGANHTLKTPTLGSDLAAISIKASNVTVTNFHIYGWIAGIYSAYNNNTITNNEITNSTRGITLYATDYIISNNSIQRTFEGIYIKDVSPSTESSNLIFNNLIVDNNWAFHIINSNRTIITQNNITDNAAILTISGELKSNYRDAGCHLLYSNNFVNNMLALHVDPLSSGISVSGKYPISPAGNWDNGTTGNYWSDYTTRYQNASEINDTGIGNTAYLIETYPLGEERTNILGNAIDRYPLIYAVDMSSNVKPQLPNWNDLTTPTTNNSNSPINIPHKYIIIMALLFAILIIIIIVTTYQRRCHKN
jgi:parallel beta-helix repeat protein